VLPTLAELSFFIQSLSDGRRAAVGVMWSWRVECGGPTGPLDGIIEKLDRLFYVFGSFKWDCKGEEFSDKVAK
jgi:hypothetical protein